MGVFFLEWPCLSCLNYRIIGLNQHLLDEKRTRNTALTILPDTVSKESLNWTRLKCLWESTDPRRTLKGSGKWWAWKQWASPPRESMERSLATSGGLLVISEAETIKPQTFLGKRKRGCLEDRGQAWVRVSQMRKVALNTETGLSALRHAWPSEQGALHWEGKISRGVWKWWITRSRPRDIFTKDSPKMEGSQAQGKTFCDAGPASLDTPGAGPSSLSACLGPLSGH